MTYFEAKYRIEAEISEKNIEKLLIYSRNDDQIRLYTGDGERFSSRKKFEKWRKKGRIIYTLVNQKGNLAGITWFGVKDGGWTLAVRLYGRARGKGWSYDFLKNSIEKLIKTDSYIESSIKTWWLECSEGNISGRKLYEKLGFVLTEKGKEEGKIIYRRNHDFEF
ncbi:MAG TPA: hypothetical protein PLU48_01190 [Candidatus Woesebacteria bacterium]|nr:hypothetical protein [Candidatus Woesebacteria bacterium]